MKKSNILLSILLVLTVLAVSGCVGPDYETVRQKTDTGYTSSINEGSGTVKLNNTYYANDEDSLLEDMNESKALEIISDNYGIAFGSNSILRTDYGTKTIEGVKVYFDEYEAKKDNRILSREGKMFFEKNGQWYRISWQHMGLANMEKNVENEIKFYVKNAGGEIPLN